MRFGGWAFAFAVAVSATGCQSERAAREAVEQQGYTEVVLTASGKGAYTFTAKKGPQACTGSVRLSSLNIPGYVKSDAEIFASCLDPEVPPAVCDKDHASVCFNQARDAEKTDPAKAAQLDAQGCDFGYAASCTNGGIAYERGAGVTKDLAKAVSYYRRSCDAKSPVGCRDLGLALTHGFTGTPDLDGAFRADTKACDLGDSDGCTNLGIDYASGQGVKKDETQARAVLDKACGKLNEQGCALFATALARGIGGPKDADRARQILDERCGKKSAEACGKLAELLVDNALPDPKNEVVTLATNACSLGSADGCVEAGLAVERGLGGTPKDDAKALSFYQKACDFDSPPGCFNVALYTKNGRGGLARDIPKARALYDKSCKLHFDDACTVLKTLPPG